MDEPPTLPPLPSHPAFIYHREWKFRLSSVALLSLAEAYGTTVPEMKGMKINATHFLKVASAAQRAVRDEGVETKQEAKVPAGKKAMLEAQADALDKLELERKLALQPLEEQYASLKEQLAEEYVKTSSDDVKLRDIRALMQDATGQLDAMKQKYKKLEAQMMAKHNGQQLELKASMPGPREKRQKSELREPAQA
eukprot:5028535-Prymnesium_polylepis.1